MERGVERRGVPQHLMRAPHDLLGASVGRRQPGRLHRHGRHQEQVALIQHEREGPHFAFHPGDFTGLKDAPDGPYDLVYTRLTLYHIDDPVAVLRTLWSWLKPGGVLIAMDFDGGPVGSFPDSEVAREIIHVINETMRRVGRDIHIGSRLPHLFSCAGIAPIAGTDVASKLLPIGELGNMPRAVLRSLREPAVKLGVASEAEIDRIDAAFAARMSDPSIYLLAPLMVSTWARKPG